MSCRWCDRDDCPFGLGYRSESAYESCQRACSGQYHDMRRTRWLATAMLVVLALLIALTGCSPTPQARPSVPGLCQILVTPPGGALLPVLWTCTGGPAHDRIACVEGCAPGDPEWTPVEGGLCVRSCATCTPATAIGWDSKAHCTPHAGDDAPDLGPNDLSP